MSVKKVPRIITRASSEPSGSSDGALGQDKACSVFAFSFMNYAYDSSFFSNSLLISLEKLHSVFLVTPFVMKKLLLLSVHDVLFFKLSCRARASSSSQRGVVVYSIVIRKE